MNNPVLINKYVILDKDNSFGYTRDLYTCVGLLVFRTNSVILSHIDTLNEKYKDVINEIINLEDDEIQRIELFKGKNTTDEMINNIRKLFRDIPCDVKDAFYDLYGKGSIGYDYNTKIYYRFDPLEEETIKIVTR